MTVNRWVLVVVIACSTSAVGRAAFAQAYPVLEVTLTNDLNAPLARRVLTPSEYLSDSSDAAAAFAANSEVALELNIDAEGLDASGYRLYVFYP